ncbi:putative signal peptide protein [Puccinia sorghi]|uniref:Putative signal peptide protein n=1 Tax=Puccinia sorghi TaxID=27349 RepID=A0A0L6V443_9BASI|nr:putative signal peptide protein [Puccinia sorghi]
MITYMQAFGYSGLSLRPTISVLSFLLCLLQFLSSHHPPVLVSSAHTHVFGFLIRFNFELTKIMERENKKLKINKISPRTSDVGIGEKGWRQRRKLNNVKLNFNFKLVDFLEVSSIVFLLPQYFLTPQSVSPLIPLLSHFLGPVWRWYDGVWKCGESQFHMGIVPLRALGWLGKKGKEPMLILLVSNLNILSRPCLGVVILCNNHLLSITGPHRGPYHNTLVFGNKLPNPKDSSEVIIGVIFTFISLPNTFTFHKCVNQQALCMTVHHITSLPPNRALCTSRSKSEYERQKHHRQEEALILLDQLREYQETGNMFYISLVVLDMKEIQIKNLVKGRVEISTEVGCHVDESFSHLPNTCVVGLREARFYKWVDYIISLLSNRVLMTHAILLHAEPPPFMAEHWFYKDGIHLLISTC